MLNNAISLMGLSGVVLSIIVALATLLVSVPACIIIVQTVNKNKVNVSVF